MTTDEQRKRMEDGEKEWIILLEIEMPIERLGGCLSDERKAGLKRMTKPELQQLSQDVQRAPAPQDAIKLTVGAICASETARRTADDKNDALCPPARMEFCP